MNKKELNNCLRWNGWSSGSQTFLSAPQTCVWWTRLKQQLSLVNTPQTTTEFGEHASNNKSLNNVLKNNDCRPIWDFGSKLLSLFSMSAFHTFLSKCLCYRQRQPMVALKIHNSGLDHLGMAHFLTHRHCYFGFDPYFGSHCDRSTSRLLYEAAVTITINFTPEPWWESIVASFPQIHNHFHILCREGGWNIRKFVTFALQKCLMK